MSGHAHLAGIQAAAYGEVDIPTMLESKAIRALLELGAFEVLLQLEAGEGLWLAGVLLEVLPVLSLLALPQLQGKL